MSDYDAAADHIKSLNIQETDTAIILGSGLGMLADSADEILAADYADIPGFPVSTVSGHKGRLVSGLIGGKRIIMMQGRFHYYEGYDMRSLVFPVRVLKKMGIKNLIVTNAAGGVNTSFSPGNLMLIDDHIKLIADSPLRGKNASEFGPRFNDMSSAYSRELIAVAEKAASAISCDLKKGVYMFMSGPSYETPAEIRAARALGADAVGMSTVPEVIAAAHCGINVLGISCITNMAAGILNRPLDHSEVMGTADKVRDIFIRLITKIIELL